MRRSGFTEEMISKSQPYIWESEPGKDELKKVRVYDLEYRRLIEGDIASASVDYIKKQAKSKKSFFPLRRMVSCTLSWPISSRF